MHVLHLSCTVHTRPVHVSHSAINFHMLLQVALYEPPEVYLPAAAEARLARHIAELVDEHSALESVFESFFARDQEEEERVGLTAGV